MNINEERMNTIIICVRRCLNNSELLCLFLLVIFFLFRNIRITLRRENISNIYEDYKEQYVCSLLFVTVIKETTSLDK